MTLERDVRRMCYVITIPREEIKGIFVLAHETKGKSTEDEIVSKMLANKILNLIVADERGE